MFSPKWSRFLLNSSLDRSTMSSYKRLNHTFWWCYVRDTAKKVNATLLQQSRTLSRNFDNILCNKHSVFVDRIVFLFLLFLRRLFLNISPFTPSKIACGVWYGINKHPEHAVGEFTHGLWIIKFLNGGIKFITEAENICRPIVTEPVIKRAFYKK